MTLPRNDKIGIGSRVKIKRGTQYDYQNGGVGTVKEIWESINFVVDWDDDLYSGYFYDEEDLEHVTS